MNYIDEIASLIEEKLKPSLRPETRAKELYRIYAVLLLTKGRGVNLSDVHDAWSAWKVAEDDGHRSIVPFSDLGFDTQQEDAPYLRAIQLAREVWDAGRR